jgi:hypothetical protein
MAVLLVMASFSRIIALSGCEAGSVIEGGMRGVLFIFMSEIGGSGAGSAGGEWIGRPLALEAI